MESKTPLILIVGTACPLEVANNRYPASEQIIGETINQIFPATSHGIDWQILLRPVIARQIGHKDAKMVHVNICAPDIIQFGRVLGEKLPQYSIWFALPDGFALKPEEFNILETRHDPDPQLVWGIFGGPGSGKKEQSLRLCEALGIKHISTGDMFRDERAKKTELGIYIGQMLDAGMLVDNDTTISMLSEQLANATEGVLLDGFPRTVAQARILVERLPIAAIIHLRASEDLCVKHILGGGGRGRTDDQEDIIRTRYKTFVQESMPCLNYFFQEGVLVIEVDAEGTIPEVFTRIMTEIEKHIPHLIPTLWGGNGTYRPIHTRIDP